MSETPFLRYVPKDPLENVRWRLKVRRAALHDRDLQQVLYDACMMDVLFFFNAFLWIFEPRSTVKTLPFCTWPHQDPAILAMDEAISYAEQTGEPRDLLADKSRAQGVTYMYLGVIIRRFIRDSMFSAGLVTRTEDLVDGANDPDTLLWKVDWMLKMLPAWFLPKGFTRSLSDHAVGNPANDATIMGYSATGDAGRGGRKTVFAIDELGSEGFIQGGKDYAILDSTQHVTNCRLIPSTFGGDSGAFYEMVQDPGNAVKVVLDWKDNPTQNRNLYVRREGIFAAVNPAEQAAVNEYAKQAGESLRRIERRGHKVDGKQRSPWYDAQCLRPGASPRSIAKELDRNPRGVAGKLFNMAVLDRMAKEKAQSPIWQGKPILRDGDLRLVEQDDGPLKLWFPLGLDDASPAGKYVLGADIGTGSGGQWASNSCLVAGNVQTGEQVLEYAYASIAETRLARLAVALCVWLGKAKLIWEATGPTGKRFFEEVKDIGYGNVWMQPKPLVRTQERTEKAGWTNQKTSDKVNLFEDLWIAWDDGLFTPRSADLLAECAGWEWDGEKVTYKGTGHGDRCIAGGLCWKAMKELLVGGVDKSENVVQVARHGTLAWRMERDKATRTRGFSDDGEGFGIQELLMEG